MFVNKNSWYYCE